MNIEHHKLTTNPGFQIEWRPRKVKVNRPEITPLVLVIHYAVTHRYAETARAGETSPNASWHLTVAGNRIAQHIEFNRRAGHAGKSSWQDREAVNDFSIGLEIANPGPLVLGADGKFRDTTPRARVWSGPVVEARHDNPAVQFTHWAGYDDATVDTVIALASLLHAHYGLQDIVGHSDVSPGRKIDPGPAFPLQAVKEAVLCLNN